MKKEFISFYRLFWDLNQLLQWKLLDIPFNKLYSHLGVVSSILYSARVKTIPDRTPTFHIGTFVEIHALNHC